MNKFISLAVAGLAAATMSHAALADGGAKFLGNITTRGQIRSDFATYWNQITPENGCKWGSIHSVDNSGKSKFAWDNYDKCASAYEWAKEKPGRHFKFHALIWGSQKPDFLCTAKNPNITVAKTKQYITEWFDAVAARFPDLEYIDVVNEAIFAGTNYHSGYAKPATDPDHVGTDDPSCGGSYIIDALGGDRVVNGKHQYDFVKTAFVMARERWPKAVLIYNDYNTLSWQIDQGIEMVQTLLKNGAPIDAYGQQAHDLKGMDKSTFESRMKKVHDAVGIPLFITEYDIGEADDTKQANDFKNQFPFMWETPWVAGITIWGYINGATWVENTGLMRESNGGTTDRASMTWLKQYMAQNLNKGQNNTQFGTVVEPEPQTPFGGKAWAIPGKIEAENFDVPGVGSGNDSYSDTDASNNGDSDYRKGTGVDIKNAASGRAIGWFAQDEWLEYTVNVAETGTYTMYAAVASDKGATFKLSMDGKDITEGVSVPPASKKEAVEGEEDYGDYYKVSANVNLTKGTHILRITSVEPWFDIDYVSFFAGENAEDDEPIVKPNDGDDSDDDLTAISMNLNFNTPKLADYDIFSINGMFMGRVSGYSMQEAVSTVKNSNVLKSGVYCIRSRANKQMQTIRIAR